MHSYKGYHKFEAVIAGNQIMLSCDECSVRWLLEPSDIARMEMTLERQKDWESDSDNQDYLGWYAAILAPRLVGKAPHPILRFDRRQPGGVSVRSVPGHITDSTEDAWEKAVEEEQLKGGRKILCTRPGENPRNGAGAAVGT